MTRAVLLLIGTLLVAGCAGALGGDRLTLEQQLALACDQYATALDRAVPFKPVMTPRQVEIIDGAVSVIEPACVTGLEGTSDQTALELLRLVNLRLGEMIAVYYSVNPNDRTKL